MELASAKKLFVDFMRARCAPNCVIAFALKDCTDPLPEDVIQIHDLAPGTTFKAFIEQCVRVGTNFVPNSSKRIN